MFDEKLEDILKDAQTLYVQCQNSHSNPTWTDYEYFKNRMHDSNIYGHEYELTQILHI